MGNLTNCPCYQCELRAPVCHSSCKEYIQWANKREEQRQAKVNSPEYLINNYFCNRKYKNGK